MNKKEKFIKKMKDLYEINLPYNKDDSFNRKRNIIYTEIPQYQETYALSSIVNSKEVKKVEQHIGNKYWIFLNWEEIKMNDLKQPSELVKVDVISVIKMTYTAFDEEVKTKKYVTDYIELGKGLIARDESLISFKKINKQHNDEENEKATIQMLQQMNGDLLDIKKLVVLITKILSDYRFPDALNFRSLNLVPSSLREELYDCRNLLNLEDIE